MVGFARDGYVKLPWDRRVADWAAAAEISAQGIDVTNRRHGNTWFVGVDAMQNAPDGSIGGVALDGDWTNLITPPKIWHKAQLSIVFPGYPGRDLGESDAAHLFRRNRDAAHLDGLLPEGPDKRRHLREPHGFILGLPLSDVADSPLVVWRGSHRVIGEAFRTAFAGTDPSVCGDVDVTEVYQAARQRVFATCERVVLPAKAGEVTLLHRHCIHGVAPWGAGKHPRPIAYFRPVIAPQDWL